MRLFRRIVLAILALTMVAGLIVPAMADAATPPPASALSFRLVTGDVDRNSTEILAIPPDSEVLPQVDAEDPELWVMRTPLLDGADVTCVGMAGAPDDAPAAGPNVRLVFDGAQREHLAAVTGAHVGTRIALVLNGKVLMAPVLQDPITGGEVVVYGEQGWDARALRDTIHRDAGVPLCPAT